MTMSNMHSVGSCGGSKAIVGLAAMYWTMSHWLGWTAHSWASMGGSSGATIIQAIARGAHLTVAQVLDLMLSKNFEDYIDYPPLTKMQRLRAFVRYHKADVQRPWRIDGIVRTERLGELIDELVPGWPEGLWMLGTDQECRPIIFSDKGVHRWSDGDTLVQLTDKTISVGLAVRMSCSIPELFTPPKLDIEGVETPIWDGAFTRRDLIAGLCPVQVPIKHWLVPAEHILAFDVAEERPSWGPSGLLSRAVRYWWGVKPDPPWPREAESSIRIAPRLPISGLNLALTLDQKWQVIAVTVCAVSQALIAHGLMPVAEHKTAERLGNDLRPFTLVHLANRRSNGFRNDLCQALCKYGICLTA
jgi:hypothetical protein